MAPDAIAPVSVPLTAPAFGADVVVAADPPPLLPQAESVKRAAKPMTAPLLARPLATFLMTCSLRLGVVGSPQVTLSWSLGVVEQLS